MAIRLMIADDHEVVRAGINSMLNDSDISVVAEAANGAEVLAMAQYHKPDVILLDVRMPDVDGMACLSRLRSELPETPVVIFTGHDNPTYIARAVALGAAGYLIKNVVRDELISALRQVARGETLWNRENLRRVSGAIVAGHSNNGLDIPLTKREGEVLKQLALGLSNKEIAQALSISYETVKEHVQHVLRKLGVSDRTQAAVWAVRKGFV